MEEGRKGRRSEGGKLREGHTKKRTRLVLLNQLEHQIFFGASRKPHLFVDLRQDALYRLFDEMYTI
jgi:hypothetical protein